MLPKQLNFTSALFNADVFPVHTAMCICYIVCSSSFVESPDIYYLGML